MLQKVLSVLQYNFKILVVAFTCTDICGLGMDPYVYSHRQRTVVIKIKQANLFGSLQLISECSAKRQVCSVLCIIEHPQ